MFDIFEPQCGLLYFFFFNSPVVPAFFKPTFARCAVALNDIFVVALC